MSCYKCNAESSVVIFATSQELCWNCYAPDEPIVKCFLCEDDATTERIICRQYVVKVCEDCALEFGFCDVCCHFDLQLRHGWCPYCSNFCFMCGTQSFGICQECRNIFEQT